MWEDRFGGETHQTGLQGGSKPAPMEGRPKPLRWQVLEPLDHKGVRSSLSLVIRRKATPFLVLCAHRGTEGTIYKKAPDLVEPKLTGESSLGPADSQAWAPLGYGKLEEGSTRPGSGGGPAGAPEPKLAEEASPGPVDSQVWAPQGTAGWRKRASTPGLVGVQLRPLNPN
ncbi:hypothetical protein NDU88_006094 [Pleurodeles waltl]|uniref:Uncharacterized protein n=1 Tax=Pleurodeles waltl TaxID=8319 RepID=A0AAV7SNU9_PLEWA|nr:hypothetical protein NDU88_006094 [Pleurodeles waltl]